MILVQILKAMRPHQWVKNLFVLAPLVFAEQALSSQHILLAAAAFGLFSALSGCVYILNDIIDVEGDRQHPTKRNRAIASGRLPLPTARLALAVILLLTISVSFLISTPFAAVGMGYFVLNVGYSFALKHVPFIDVICIASGFVLRLVGGAVAIGAPVTAWVFACTFLLALYLGLGKRKHELAQAGAGAGKQRKVLTRYQLAHVKQGMAAFGLTTIAVYSAYVAWGDHVGMLFAPQELVWTIPCVVIGVLRFYQLTGRIDKGTSPTDLMLSDAPFLLNLAAYAGVVIAVIYA